MKVGTLTALRTWPCHLLQREARQQAQLGIDITNSIGDAKILADSPIEGAQGYRLRRQCL
jgi:hypothetical protein